MSGSNTKFCSSCGKEIPISSEFCPHCGKQQPTTSDNITKPATLTPQVTTKSSSNKKWVLGILAIAIIVAAIFGISWAVNHSKSPESIASSIQSKLRSQSSDYGKAKVTWDGDNGVMEISLPKSSHAVKSLEEGSPALWNSLVRELKTSSTSINGKNNPKYSYLTVLNPNDSSYLWLEINHGKIKYNQADNLN